MSRKLGKVLALIVCLTNNLIIYIGDVHAQPDVVAEKVPQDSLDNVESNVCSTIHF